jgi:hypothetical protein
VADDLTLCLGEGRFQVTLTWRDFEGGAPRAARTRTLTDESGAFWFLNPANLEVMVKIVDGREINGHFWFFHGSLSNVAYEIRVTDTSSGQVHTYTNPARSFASDGDTEAF